MSDRSLERAVMERKAALALSRSRCNDPPQMIFAIAASNIYGRTVQQTATWFELPPDDVAALVGAAEQLQAASAHPFRCRTSAETLSAEESLALLRVGAQDLLRQIHRVQRGLFTDMGPVVSLTGRAHEH